MKKLRNTVKRGSGKGTVLTPHRHDDGQFVVSFTRFETEYRRVKRERDLPRLVAEGYKVRMSNPSVKSHRSPSLIAPASIEIYED
jgi:hypothetical protein